MQFKWNTKKIPTEKYSPGTIVTPIHLQTIIYIFNYITILKLITIQSGT
jgi:hypothetical protein